MAASVIIEIVVLVTLAYLAGCVVGVTARWIALGNRRPRPSFAARTTILPEAAAPAMAADPRTAISPARRLAAAANDEPDLAPITADQIRQIQPPAKRRDDLRRIRGIGPAIEQRLTELGIVNYAQIASWTKADITRVESGLPFKGRIIRDNWVGQARDLSAGDRAEVA